MGTTGTTVVAADERSADVIGVMKRIIEQAEQEQGERSNLLAQIQSLLPQGGMIEQLIRILLADHPDARWIDIRPTIEWALSVRNGAEEVLLGMVLRREVIVTNTDYLQLKLNTGSRMS
jgi:hypothetical protein